MFFVTRSTFLYHYFSGLIFLLGIAAVLAARLLRLDGEGPPRRAAVGAVLVFVVVGFLSAAPLTYGL
jgi:dolichyl-phosphate-mannose--protein O-mannosyl transferase